MNIDELELGARIDEYWNERPGDETWRIREAARRQVRREQVLDKVRPRSRRPKVLRPISVVGGGL